MASRFYNKNLQLISEMEFLGNLIENLIAVERIPFKRTGTKHVYKK